MYSYKYSIFVIVLINYDLNDCYYQMLPIETMVRSLKVYRK